MSDEFSREIAKRSIARVCVALDYKYATSSVLDILADVMSNFVQTLGEQIRDQAEISGRCLPGIHDAIAVLDQAVSFSISLYFSYELLMDNYGFLLASSTDILERASGFCI